MKVRDIVCYIALQTLLLLLLISYVHRKDMKVAKMFMIVIESHLLNSFGFLCSTGLHWVLCTINKCFQEDMLQMTSFSLRKNPIIALV